MNYYFLDGPEKRGPFTADEMRAQNLSDETLVYYDGIAGWKPKKDIAELKALPPKPVDDEVFKQHAVVTNNPSPIKIPALILLFVSWAVVIAGCYFVVNSVRSRDLSEMDDRISLLMGDGDILTDYVNSGTDGQLVNVYIDKLVDNGDYNIIKEGSTLLAIKPQEGTPDYNERLKTWKLYIGLVQYYECSEFGGFSVLRLEYHDGQYYLTENWSGDMAYKVAENKYIPGYSSEYFNMPGYTVPTYRPAVGSCYENAAKFLTAEREDHSYKPGAYNRISSFPNLETDYYEIAKIYPFYKRVLNGVKMDMVDGTTSGMVEGSKKTSSADPSVYNNQWIVWYKEITNKYYVHEKKGVFYRNWGIYSLVGILLSSLIYFIFRFRKRIRVA